MTALRRSALALGTAVCAVAMASGPAADALATTAPQAPAHTVAQQHTAVHETGTAVQGGATVQSTLRRQWGPSWISGSYLTHHGKKWVSQPYRSKGKTAYAYLQCYNTNAKMRVRIYNVEAQRYIADSGKVTCNPHKAFHTKTKAFQHLDHLRIVVNGDQGSEVWASYRR
ncbi:hypothetical protein ABZ656_18940 [Streptomyces sp. NPDC007095]|uniref:hypothetical protein n=1 Tax=Streptomyces sp. NPDC007095 TaxID=3154482 RepID=UPI0033F732D8